MVVREILRTKRGQLITGTVSMPVLLAMELMINNRISCLPVLDGEGRLTGMISDKDVFKRLYDDGGHFQDVAIGDLMTTNVIVGLLGDEISYIAGLMTTNHIRHIPILDGDELVGLVSVGDIVKTQMEDIVVENRYLRQYIDGSYPA